MTEFSASDIYRTAKLHEQPEYVKTAQAEDFGLGKKLSPDWYADGAAGQYPMHNRASTWLSAARVLDKRASLKPEDVQRMEARLMKQAEWLGITGDLFKLAESQAKQEVGTVLQNEDYAYVVKEGAVEHRHYPLRHDNDIQAAAEYVQKHRNKLTYPERRMMARRILNKAAKLGVAFNEDRQYFLDKQAGRGTCSTEQAVGLIKERLHKVGPNVDPKAKETLEKIAAHVEENPQTDLNGYDWTRDRVAEAIYLLDKEANLEQHYGKSLDYPEDVLFSLTAQKVASFKSALVETQNGDVYDREEFRKIGYDFVQDSLGQDIADACCLGGFFSREKFAEVLPTIPRQAAKRFAADLAERSIHKLASAEIKHRRLTPADWLSLAAETSSGD